MVEGLYTTGDKDGIVDGKLSSVLTGNIWGSPVGIYSSHRALLLFPDPQVVNRYYSAVHDISNLGMGTTAFFFNAYHDFIPNRFNVKLGLPGHTQTWIRQEEENISEQNLMLKRSTISKCFSHLVRVQAIWRLEIFMSLLR